VSLVPVDACTRSLVIEGSTGTMSINFTLSDEQRKLQHEVRSFAENVLAPVVAEADREPDPVTAVQRTKPAYV
jgi:nitroalkane oxidase